MKHKLVYRLLFSILGVSFICIGIALFSQSGINGDCLTVLYIALTNKFGLTIGRWTFIVGMVELIIPLIFDRKKIGFTTLFFAVIGQYIVDFFISIIPSQTKIIYGVLYILIATVIISIGSIFCLAARVGLTLFDAFCFSISDHFKIKYTYVRYGVDAFHLILALILGGSIGIGTIICLLISGITIDIIKKMIYEPLVNILN